MSRRRLFNGNSDRGYWHLEDYYVYYDEEDDDMQEQYYAFCMMEEQNNVEQCENW